MRSRSGAARLAVVLGTILATPAAHAEDWLQYRKDAQRTATSRDPLAFPMVDVWDVSTPGLLGEDVHSHVAVWNGRAYFLANQERRRFLVCANAKTGAVLWRQPLQGASSGPRGEVIKGVPVVSPSGKVFVYDYRGGKPLPPVAPRRTPAGLRPNPRFPSKWPQTLEQVSGFAVLVYDALTGQPLALMPTAVAVMMPSVPQVDLLHGQARTTAPLAHIKPSRARTEYVPWLGIPLLFGEELYATSLQGTLFRWVPGGAPSFIRIAHPPPGPIPEITIPAQFGGYPPVAAGNGIFIADDQSFRFAAVVGGEEFHRWHQDLNQAIGVAASTDSYVFAGLGGPGGARSLTCLDSNTGQTRWTFAPTGLPFERQAIEKKSIEWSKTVMADTRNRALNEDQILELAAKLKAKGYDYATEWERVWMPQPRSILPSGHPTSGGVVATGGRVYAEVSGAIVALDQITGRPYWSQPLPFMGQVNALVAGPKHLIACYAIAKRGKAGGHQQLVALNLETGKVEWEQVVNRPGNLSLSDGLVYFSNGDLTVMGPAERTYLIASDTDDADHYVKPRPARKEEDPNAPPPAVTGETPPEPKPVVPLHPAARADASWLRLSLAMPDAELVAKVRARVKLAAAKEVPLSLQLDWLDPTRSAVAGAQGGNWSPAAEERFVKLCAVLAAEAGPQYFDLAPDVNVYLRRYPERTEAVLKLLQRATRAAREGAPGCQVIVSLQVETLLGAYGSGLVSPFGKLAKLEQKTQVAQLTRLTELADAIGLNIEPQAGFRNAGVIPRDYLLRVRLLLPGEPLLVTRIKIEADAPGLVARDGQALYVQRTLQCCYWLNARTVMQPELTGYVEGPLDAEPTQEMQLEPGSGTAPGTAPPPVVTPGAKPAAGKEPVKNAAPAKPAGPLDPIRLAATKWRRVVLWERVQRLTARPPLPDLVGAEETDEPRVEGQ